MEQTKALNALEPFLALSKSANSSRAAADLVNRATSAPNTFVFAELLETPSIRALSDSDQSAYFTLLQIFSYGTFQTYQSTPNLPTLNDSQTLKLRQLSVLTLARDRNNLTYEALQSALGLDTSRDLEDLIISTIYAGLLDATLDPYRQAVQVNSLSPLRDVAPGAIEPLIQALNAWSGRCTSALGDIQAHMTKIRQNAVQRQREKEEWDKEMERLTNKDNPESFGMRNLSHVSKALTVGVGAGAGMSRSQRQAKRGPGSMLEEAEELDEEAMDIDDEDDAGEKKRSSRRKL